jgi:hypothetical protein
MSYFTKAGIYLTSLGGLLFLTGMICTPLMGLSYNKGISDALPGIIYGSIAFIVIGALFFSKGVYNEEVKKTKDEVKK